jgi:uncharacterized membrane protein YhaH (DUF805 family)
VSGNKSAKIKGAGTMTFTQAIKSGFSNYVNFTGRSARSEFWYWALFATLIGTAINIVDYGLGSGSGLLGELWGLATFLPGLAVGARRLHDTDRSGFWLFLVLLPLIGLIVLIVWWCMKGTSGSNQYGPDPLSA